MLFAYFSLPCTVTFVCFQTFQHQISLICSCEISLYVPSSRNPSAKDWCDKRLYLISVKPVKPAVTAVWEDLQSPVAFASWDRVSDFFLLFRNCVHQLIHFRLRGPTQRQGSLPNCFHVSLQLEGRLVILTVRYNTVLHVRYTLVL